VVQSLEIKHISAELPVQAGSELGENRSVPLRLVQVVWEK